MKTVYASLDAVEQVKDVAEQIPALIAGRKYLTATELVISSLAVLDTELSDVDALQQASLLFSFLIFCCRQMVLEALCFFLFLHFPVFLHCNSPKSGSSLDLTGPGLNLEKQV